MPPAPSPTPTKRPTSDSAVADDIDRSLIREQVEMGVAVRMAVLDALARNLPNELALSGGRS